MTQNLAVAEPACDPLRTEGIKYAGSKRTLIPHILKLIAGRSIERVFDGFAGTTRVSQSLAKAGYEVIANDTAAWSAVFGRCYLLNDKPAKHYQPIIDHLNNLPGVAGWFSEHYGGVVRGASSVQPDGRKRPWQIGNTMKLDAIRQEIDNLSLPVVEEAVLLTSLILALDKVDSTLGHHASYLKDWSPRSYKRLQLRTPALICGRRRHQIHRADVLELTASVDVDLAYFDPPYGSNNDKMPPSRVRYASYYHLWTTVCLNDQPELVGVANRRADCSDVVTSSPFEDFRRDDGGRFVALRAIEALIERTRAPFVLLSYSSGGRATAEQLHEVLEKHGTLAEVVTVDYQQNVMSQMRWTNEWTKASDRNHKEFLFLLER